MKFIILLSIILQISRFENDDPFYKLLPDTHLVILGQTGVGKSSLANILLGVQLTLKIAYLKFVQVLIEIIKEDIVGLRSM